MKSPCLVKRPVLSGCPRCPFFLFTSWELCLLSSCNSVLRPCAGAFELTMAHISELAWIKPYRGRQLSSSMYQQPGFLSLLARSACRMPSACSTLPAGCLKLSQITVGQPFPQHISSLALSMCFRGNKYFWAFTKQQSQTKQEEWLFWQFEKSSLRVFFAFICYRRW